MGTQDGNQCEREPFGHFNRERGNRNLFGIISGEPSAGRLVLARYDLPREWPTGSVNDGEIEWTVRSFQLE
jgi:hypothetical protein